MRYVAAYLLAVLGGNKAPNGNDIEKILGSVGIESEQDKVGQVISQLGGKDINQIIEEGKKKLSSMPAGGGAVVASAGAASAPAAAGGGGGAAPAKKEEKKEEVKDEESDEDLGFGLFD